MNNVGVWVDGLLSVGVQGRDTWSYNQIPTSMQLSHESKNKEFGEGECVVPKALRRSVRVNKGACKRSE